MTRVLYLAFAAAAYLFFLVTFVALIVFVSGSSLLPFSIDRGASIGGVAAGLVDLVLILLFGLQHSVMARPAFKKRWTNIVPAPLERSVFVIGASALLWVLFLFWQPLPTPVWDVSASALRVSIWALFFLGWALVLISTFLINHFELFGLQQAWLFVRGRTPRDAVFATPLLYRMMRHPLYAGFLLAFWATPRMSLGHVIFAASMTAYILIAIAYEERDLVQLFGEPYRLYQARVNKLFPKLPVKAAADAPDQGSNRR
jgi:methanethiol S-methyltransferase